MGGGGACYGAIGSLYKTTMCVEKDCVLVQLSLFWMCLNVISLRGSSRSKHWPVPYVLNSTTDRQVSAVVYLRLSCHIIAASSMILRIHHLYIRT